MFVNSLHFDAEKLKVPKFLLKEAIGEVSHGVLVRDFLALLAQMSVSNSGKPAERENGPFFSLSKTAQLSEPNRLRKLAAKQSNCSIRGYDRTLH